MKRRILAMLLAVLLLLSLVPTAAAQTRRPYLSASEDWTMGSGWVDCSTTEAVAFELTTDTAGPNFNRNLIDGSAGFKIGFDVEFLDSTKQTTANVTLRLNSDSMSYFRIYVTGRGDEALFQVDYCDNGSWKTVVPFADGLNGTGGKVHVELEREENHDTVSFKLYSASGTELLNRKAADKAYAGNRFLNCGDLEFIVAPIAGYGCFRFSDYQVEPYADDGVEDPVSADAVWNLGGNWTDLSDAEHVTIGNTIQNAGPSFFKEHLTAGESFRVGFLYTGVSGYTTADITLRRVSANDVYFRMLFTQNNGTALVDVNFFDGANWHSLGSTGWIANAGSSYYATVEHTKGADTLHLILQKPDGTLISSNTIDCSAAAGYYMFSDELEPLVSTCGDYGLFTLTDFTVHAAAVEAAQWSMGANWESGTDADGSFCITNKIQNAGPNFFGNLIPAGDDFALSFRYTGQSAYTTADITLRLTAANSTYLRMLATQNNGTAYFEANFYDGRSWHNLANSGWIADVGSTYDVLLTHTGDAMTLTLKKTDGTVFFTQELNNAVFAANNFFTRSSLEALVTTAGNYGIFTIAGFRVAAPISAAEYWELGSGWTDCGGYDGAVIGNTTDTDADSAIYKEELDATDGMTIDFDFAAADNTRATAAELLLRRADDNNQYLCLRLTADSGTAAAATLSYCDGSKRTTLCTADGISADVTDGFHVTLSHQVCSVDTTLTLTAKDGSVLFTQTFSNASLTDKTFWTAYYLQLLVNAVANGGCFTVANLEIGKNAAEPYESDLWSCGTGWVTYADNGDVILSKNDRSQTEAVCSTAINGLEGFRVSFDIVFDRSEDSSCYFKLRVPERNEIYLFARVKGSNRQTVLEAQSYIASEDKWSTSLLSADAAQWKANNGMVHVVLERQALSEQLRYCAVDVLTGETLIDETFSDEVLSADKFLDYNGLQWMFGADAGTGTFKIYHFAVEEYPAAPIALTALSVDGADSTEAGSTEEYSAVLTPADATVRTYEWSVDGGSIGTGKLIRWQFDSEGEHTVSLTATDRSGNVLTAEKTVTVTPKPIVYDTRDLNTDGVIDGQDAQLLADAIVGNATLTAAQQTAADLNADGALTAEDCYLLLNYGQTKKTRTVTAVPEPAANTYRFNGHGVTDRSSFDCLDNSWILRSSTDAAPTVVAGSAGEGVRYNCTLNSEWYLGLNFTLQATDEAGLYLYAGNEKVLTVALSTADGVLTVTAGGNAASFAAADDVRVIADNREDGLTLCCYCADTYLGGLRAAATEALRGVTAIGFYATKAGTVFSDFGVNNMLYAYENDPDYALSLVENWARSEIEGSIVYANNGVPMYTPDGVKNYNALWTRDFTYMLEYGGDYIPTENAVACINYLLEHVHEGDCWLPDRVYANGAVNYAAGDMPFNRANLDNNSFIVIALDCVLSRMSAAEGKALFERWQTTLRTALDAIPKDANGLVCNDPLNPHSPYGFTDCICKTGSLMKESLLLWRAESIMAKWQKAYGLDSAVAARNAKRIENVLIATFRNEDGMLDAATVDCAQSDIWGSCYAVSIGFPMEDTLKKSIADYIAANYDGLVQMGQLRHTAPGTYWDRLLSGVDEGTYQNGAYWATPTGWLIDTLEPYYPQLAMETLQDIITYYEAEGIYECVNGTYQKLIHYGASASNILPAARRLLSALNVPEAVTVSGDRTAKTGATLTFTAAVTPSNAKVTAWTWTINGETFTGSDTVSYRFTSAGVYTVTCAVSSYSGAAAEDSITVTVTDGVYAPVALSVTGVSGKAGDTVTAAYRLDSGELVYSDLTVCYDADTFELLAADGGTTVFAANEITDGTVAITLANKTALAPDSTLFTLQFRLRKDTAAAYAPETTVQTVGILPDDNSGTHTVTATVSTAAPTAASITAAYLTLRENIDVTYVVEAPDGIGDGYMVFTMNGFTSIVTDYTVKDGNYCFTFAGVTPQCMCDNICAELFMQKDAAVCTDAVTEYSVRQYCENQLEKNPNNAELVTLLSDLLTYGAATQQYINYKTDTLATDGLSLTPSTFTAFAGKQASLDGTVCDTVRWNGVALVLKGTMTMRLYFTATELDGLTLTAAVNGRVQTFTAEDFHANGENGCYVDFCGIYANEFDETVTASFAQNGVPLGRTLSYSVNAYVCSTQNAEHSGLRALVRALYNYGVSAAAYTDAP